MDNQNPWNALNLLNVVSVFLALENLYENRAQTAQNDVNAANERESRYLLEELGKRFNEQNEMLAEILEILRND